MLEFLGDLESPFGCIVYGIKKFEASESKNCLIGLGLVQFSKLNLKSPRRKNHLFFFDILFRRMLLFIKGESRIDYRTQCVVMTLGMGWGEAITDNVLKFRKSIEF